MLLARVSRTSVPDRNLRSVTEERPAPWHRSPPTKTVHVQSSKQKPIRPNAKRLVVPCSVPSWQSSVRCDGSKRHPRGQSSAQSLSTGQSVKVQLIHLISPRSCNRTDFSQKRFDQTVHIKRHGLLIAHSTARRNLQTVPTLFDSVAEPLARWPVALGIQGRLRSTEHGETRTARRPDQTE
jgi:hypothetical protein